MRKAQKNQIENMIETFYQAHKEVEKEVQGGRGENARILLAQCQDGAIQIGSLIEETEGKDFAAVQILEGYCERIYWIYEKIGQGQHEDISTDCKRLNKVLMQIEDSIKNDIQIRTEIVFLPYKASMWDSLESIWKAADRNPNCDAYVIPIPYFDKNPDGSLKEIHYEGNQYPDYVSIKDYHDYDFAVCRPDIIYIHNPYDEYNYATSVHPFFYSSNLKQYTEKLVYIPYFLLPEINPENKSAIRRIEHFCSLPAVINADEVIVQSENMRKVYIKVLTELLGEETKAYWEKKILGTGSPKIDKVINIKREDLKIPEQWKTIIEKPDGSWKKIVFYNTSISALLKYDKKMLQKIQYVFGIFRDNQEEVALLWRPHPLIKATIESMRPQLWEM